MTATLTPQNIQRTTSLTSIATFRFRHPEHIDDHLDSLEAVFELLPHESHELLIGLTRLVCVFLKPEPLTQGFEDAKKLLDPASFVLGGGPSGLDLEGKSI